MNWYALMGIISMYGIAYYQMSREPLVHWPDSLMIFKLIALFWFSLACATYFFES